MDARNSARAQSRTLVGEVAVDAADVALPVAVVELQQAVGGGDPALGDVFQLGQVAALVDHAAREAGAVLQAFAGDVDHVLRHLLDRAAGDLGLEAEAGNVAAQAFVILDVPVLDQVPGGGERRGVVEDAGP